MNSKKYTKYVIIILAVIFLISAALLLLELWEKHRSEFPELSEKSDVIEYNGQKYSPKKDVETFLVMGLDKFQGSSTADSHESGIQADFLMLFVIDNEAKKCTALHINRDTMVNINKVAIGGVKVDSFTKQIALAYNYVADDNEKVKCRNVKDSAESLLNGVKIDHYLSLTMDSVAILNDLVGGVEVTVLDDFTGIDDFLVKDKKVTLMGEHALCYIRTRYGLEDSTNSTRMARQQQYINALYSKVNTLSEADDEFFMNLIDKIDEYIVYDSSDQKMVKLAEKFNDYEFLGVRELDGETIKGDEFLEFYPKEDSILDFVIDSFYVSKKNDNG